MTEQGGGGRRGKEEETKEADNIRISGVSLISCRPEVCEH